MNVGVKGMAFGGGGVGSVSSRISRQPMSALDGLLETKLRIVLSSRFMKYFFQPPLISADLAPRDLPFADIISDGYYPMEIGRIRNGR